MILSKTQSAIARMVTSSTGFQWGSYDENELNAARSIVKQCITIAPDSLSQKDFNEIMSGASQKRTKNFYLALSDALSEDIWQTL